MQRSSAEAMQKPSHGELSPRGLPEARTRAAPPTSDLSTRVDKRAWRIAIVDDDSTWLEFVKLGLSARGYDVMTFDHGQELLDSPLLRAADLVVLDYHLPDFDGVSLCEAVHQIRPAVRTVLCTGDAQSDVVVAALRQGFNDYVVKPVSVDALDACVRRLLDDRQRERQLRRKPRLRLDSGKMIPGTAYRLDGWIGEGGMGTVYRGTHVSIERKVALKVLHPEHCVREASVRTFRNEARASARIGAPNIVDIFDFAELEDGRLLIAMEYLHGTSLDVALRSERIGVERMLPIARQICRGLAAAHEAGIVHRDIKPANVMLVHREGRGDFVKLVDFGIAAFSELGGAQPLAGTPNYMAPESIQFGTVDVRVDEYAFGCLLYEWAAGSPPFVGTTEDVLRAQIESEPPSLSERHPGLPEGIVGVINRCLAKQPDDRFGSMAEVEAALCEVQIELGLRTPYDDLPMPPIDAVRREDLAGRMPRQLPTRAQRRRRRLLSAVAGVALLAATGAGWARLGGFDDQTEQAATEIRDRVEAARLAASRFYFVYPPVGDPAAPTAYSEVAAIEDLGTPAAKQAAAGLRREFAETLVRLGDRYWTFEHGRGFAREYYAMARLFTPDRAEAIERAAMTPSMLEELRSRAAARDFVEGELAAVQPLLALAEDDPVERSEKLREIEDDPSQPGAVVQRIARLEAERSTGARAPRRERRAAERPPATEMPVASDTTSSPNEIVPPRARRPHSASAHLRQAERARGKGRLRDAEMYYHRAIDADPGDARGLDGLAAMAYDSGEYSKSVRFARLAASRGAPSGRRFIALGDAHFKILRYSDALTAYERAHELGAAAATGRIAKVRDKLGR
jgi:CheY-like chemotaxis protein